jgi:hypothetical protein
MSCLLRASGQHFDVDEFLKVSSLDALAVFHRGEGKASGSVITQRRSDLSGVSVRVSLQEFSDLVHQIEDAVEFLESNDEELKRLRDFPGVERIDLDFSLEDRDLVFQSDAFPPRLLSLLGGLRIGLVVSRHPAYRAADDQLAIEQ